MMTILLLTDVGVFKWDDYVKVRVFKNADPANDKWAGVIKVMKGGWEYLSVMILVMTGGRT
jgi:hypothetical protein